LAATGWLWATCTLAQGLNATGVVGGLSIPDARPLGSGTLALGLGNPREPQVVQQSQRSVSYLLGVGLAPGLDIVGRLAEYSTRDATGLALGGISDLSANVKLSTAIGRGDDAPRVAVGVNDFRGGAVNFRAAYAVATQPWGPWSLTLGAGSSQARQTPGTRRALNGIFGGIDYRLTQSQRLGTLTLSAEHDGRQPLAGARWASPPLAALGGAQFTASAHRTAPRGPMAAATAVGFFVSVPFDEDKPAAAPALTESAVASDVPQAASDSGPARLGRLKDTLVGLGLEKVRVGQVDKGTWVIEYQNHRYGRQELDALGVVLGHAAAAAPAEVRRIVVTALKNGQAVLSVDVAAAAWRDFMRDGRAGPARAALQVQRGGRADGRRVDWISDQPGPATALQVRLWPDLRYAVGTEYGAFDYSLAARTSVTVPLWTGAQLLANAMTRLAVSDQATTSGAFASLRQPEGLRALALHQSLWLGRHVMLGGAAGVFEYDAPGVEGEALLFVPGRDDVLRLRGRELVTQPGMPKGADFQQWISYRWVPDGDGWLSNVWVEFGAQRYSDRSHGPLVTISRWWGDLGAHLVYRKGGMRQFAGLELSVPLTPRAAPRTGPVQILGASQWRQGLRTRITDKQSAGNWVEPDAVREYAPAWDIELRSLDAGRLGPAHLRNHLPRLREAYLTLRTAGS
jgi:hypothetical protein